MQLPRTFPELLAARAAAHTPCLFDRDTPVPYAALAAESRRVAAGLARLGVQPGDRVAIWLPNVTAWLASFLACAQLGAIAVAVNTRFRSQELADIVGRSGAKLLVFWPGYGKTDFNAVLAGCGASSLPALQGLVAYAEGEPVPTQLHGKPVTAYAALAGGAEHPGNAAAADAGCAIFTTSGTTKAPKFVLHDQKTLIAHAFDVVRGFGLHPRSALYLAPPLCGVFGFCNAFAAIAAQRPMHMHPSWDATLAAQSIEAHGITHLNATDDAVSQLLATTARTPAFPSVEFIGYAAFNPAQADIVERADARGLTLVGLYGISEIQALFSRQDEHAPREERVLGGGRMLSPLARVRARDPESGRVLPHGESGELEFLAPSSRMVEYYGNPQATAEAITADGWYRSGDLGYTQADGRFVYLTRMGDSLRLSGFLVSPLEIEAAVQDVPGIVACQVVGAARGSQFRPVAFVILAPGATLDEAAVIAHVSAQLAKYKVPVRVFAVEAFPVTEGTNATKIQKHRLRELAEARLREADGGGEAA